MPKKTNILSTRLALRLRQVNVGNLTTGHQNGRHLIFLFPKSGGKFLMFYLLENTNLILLISA
jgi:hypothetical protein